MPIALRSDFDAATLRRLARLTRNSAQARRLLALAVIYDGGSRAQAAETGGVTRQIVRDWVVKFNAEGPAYLGEDDIVRYQDMYARAQGD
jgi:hypothetical protein